MFLASPPPLPAVTAATAPISSKRFGFEGAELGMDIASWRASSPNRDRADCKPSHDPRILVCRTPALPLGGGYRTRDLTHVFVDGRLARVEFTTSVDGFAYATAALKGAFGQPATIVRDRVKISDGAALPHVRMTWRNGRSTIELSDPRPTGETLSVRFTLDAAADRLANLVAGGAASRGDAPAAGNSAPVS